tara:strand:- start:1447 stop:2073 length:627 start_codon:yes stop_codon:yes gene_type:complete
MCYNFESSVGALGLGLGSAYLMYKRSNKFDLFMYPLVFAYSFMQLAEAFMWYDKDCGQLNKLGGYLAYYSLSSHVLAQGISLYLINKNHMGIIIGLLSICYLTYVLPVIECSKKRNHIEWGFNPGFYRWIYVLTIGVGIMTKISWKYKLAIIAWFSFIWLYFFHKQYNIKNLNYIIDESIDGTQLSSVWCNIAALSAPFIYLLGGTKF